ncbi:MAG: ribonuclease E/G [Gammaproteobacteria bacterium TMED119]|nr:MAG: ribonuclease E/G [Gammaproteobacteria bacterium TMED119]RCL46596.1 MAG: ribonuclease G [Candidatus Thioglobus sp.]|tara:strand:+ start:2081 stop:3565 length:1485 start_codon:yes stop_codon:yes gene_type:complete
MSEEILINVTPRETRVAMVENGVLQEVHIERTARRGLVGGIFKGAVSRVMPGMDAAFVDIGLDKAAFIHASDVVNLSPATRAEHQSDTLEEPDAIADLLHEGQQVLVQVVKDQIGSKGARLTTNITVPSRYLVLLPYSNDVRLSARLEDEDERERLTAVMQELLQESGNRFGCILRTAAESASKQELRRDLHFLLRLWDSIVEKINQVDSVAEVYADLPLAVRTLRDINTDEIENITIDSRETVLNVRAFAEKLVPEFASHIKRYKGERPIFDLYGIEDEIERALQRKVMLKSGGHLVFDQTESMTTVDVNTGAFVGHRNLEETIFKTNLEAAQAIARQLRLRNLGGIIIIDFIDMEEEEHRHQVLRALEKSLDKDRAKTNICEVSALGLVEMTRKRTHESLEHIMCEPCTSCDARGSVKSAQTVCYELFREIMRVARQYEAHELLVLTSQAVVDLLVDEESDNLAELEEYTNKTIKLQVEVLYTQEQFDVVLL